MWEIVKNEKYRRRDFITYQQNHVMYVGDATSFTNYSIILVNLSSVWVRIFKIQNKR